MQLPKNSMSPPRRRGPGLRAVRSPTVRSAIRVKVSAGRAKSTRLGPCRRPPWAPLSPRPAAPVLVAVGLVGRPDLVWAVVGPVGVGLAGVGRVARPDLAWAVVGL